MDNDLNLRQLPGDEPSPEFVEDLRREIDAILDSREVSLLGGPTETVEIEADLQVLDLSGDELLDESAGPRRWMNLALAAAVVMIVGLAWLVAVRQDDRNDLTTAEPELADSLVLASEDPTLSLDEQIALLAEAVAIDTAPETRARVGERLAEADALLVGSIGVENVHDLSISPDGQTIVIGHGLGAGSGAEFSVWTLGGAGLEPIEFALDGAAYTAFRPNGDITVGTTSQFVREVYELRDPANPIPSFNADVTLEDDATSVLVRSTNAALINTETGEQINAAQTGRDIGFWRRSPDRALVVAHSGRPNPLGVLVWNTMGTTGFVDDHPLASLGVDDVRLLDLSPDGRHVAVALGDRIVIHDATTYEMVTQFPIDPAATHIEYVDDGSTLMTLHESPTGLLQLWDTTSGLRLAPPINIPSVAEGAWWSPSASSADLLDYSPASGRVAVLADDGATVEVWTISPDHWIDVACDISQLPDAERTRLGLGDSPCG